MKLTAINHLRDLGYAELLVIARKSGVDNFSRPTRDALRLAIIDRIVEQELETQKEGRI